MSGSGFRNAITNALGNLIIKSLQSPNFVSNISGWQISKDGSAQFNNLSIRGTFNGVGFVLNSAGLFIYSTGTPTLGALIVSVTNGAGVDGVGNAYAAGIQINNALLTVYSGTSNAKTSQTDYFDQAIQIENPVGTVLALIQALNGVPFTTVFQTHDGTNGDGLFRLKAGAGGGIGGMLDLGLNTFMRANNVQGGVDNIPEVWHDMRPLSNAFVGTIANELPPQYRLSADGMVEVMGAVQMPAAGGYNGLTFFTFPTSYRPTRMISFPVAQTLGTMATDTTAGSPRFYSDATGVCQFFGISPAINSSVVRFSGRFPAPGLTGLGVITI